MIIERKMGRKLSELVIQDAPRIRVPHIGYKGDHGSDYTNHGEKTKIFP